MFRKILLIAVIAVLVTSPLISQLDSVSASSHREAPLISSDPLVDNTDLYAFISPDRPDTVTIIANYIPMQTPASGPGFYNFDPNALRLAVAFAGADRVLAGSDYPHQIGSIPSMLTSLRHLGLSDADTTGILGGNAAGIYGR